MKKMKIIPLMIAAVTAILFTGCGLIGIRGSGIIVEKSYNLSDFTSVRASNTCNLTAIQGDDFQVIVSCDDNIVPYLDVYKSDNMLILDLESGHIYSHIEFDVTVVMPVLTHLEVSGASDAVATGFENSSNFTTEVSGASDVRIEFISTADINCEVSGASDLYISSVNSTGQISIDCSGASEVNCKNIASTNGDIDVSGASEVYVNLSGYLNCSVSGASTLYYSGNPRLNDIDVSVASRLERL